MLGAKHWISLFVALLIEFYSISQIKFQNWETVNFKFQISPSGELFGTHENASGWESMEYANKYFLGSSNTWLLGKSQGEAFATMTNDSLSEWWSGPIDTFTLTAKNPENWAKVWLVDQDEIDFHKSNFMDTSYTIPQSLTQWPSNLEISGIPQVLAPFVDEDKNGNYDPAQGDYPFVFGHENAYFISNDVFGEHRISGTQPAGIEVRGTLFTIPNPEFENIFFVQWYLINRSERTYDTIHFGQSIKSIIGNHSDNFIQTDVNNDAIFFFNGDDLDESDSGFQDNLPSAFFAYLNKSISSSSSFQQSDELRSMPTNSTELEYTFNGHWPNGNSKYLEGDGINGNTPTKFAYPGTSGESSLINSLDVNSGDNPGERNGFLSFSHNQPLVPGDYIKIDAVFGFALAKEQGYNPALQELNKAQKFYKKTLESKRKTSEALKKPVVANPLPIGSIIEFNSSVQSWKIINGQGQIVADHRNQKDAKKIVVNHPAGIYFLQYEENNMIFFQRIILQ